MAYRILKNAGYLPEELVLRREIVQTEELLSAATDEQAQDKHLKRLIFIKFKLQCRQGRSLRIDEDSPYFSKVVDRL